MILKAKLSLNWTGPFKLVTIVPSHSDFAPDGRPLAAKFLHINLPHNMHAGLL